MDWLSPTSMTTSCMKPDGKSSDNQDRSKTLTSLYISRLPIQRNTVCMPLDISVDVPQILLYILQHSLIHMLFAYFVDTTGGL